MDRNFAATTARRHVRFSSMSPYAIYETLLKLNTNSKKEFTEKNIGAKMGYNPVSPMYAVLAMGEYEYMKARATVINFLPYGTVYMVHPDNEYVIDTYFTDYVYDAFIEVDGTEFLDGTTITPANNPGVEQVLLYLNASITSSAFLLNRVPLLRNIYIVDKGIPNNACVQMMDVCTKYPRRFIERAQKENKFPRKDSIIKFNANVGDPHSSFFCSMSKQISIEELMDIVDVRDKFIDIKLINVAYSIACAYLKFVQTGIDLIDRCTGSDALIGIGQFKDQFMGF